MDTEDIGFAFIIGFSAVLLTTFFIGRHLYLDAHPAVVESPAKVSDETRTLIQAAPEITPPHDPAAQRQVLRHVYECVVNGQRVFSDSQCAPNVKLQEIHQSNTMPPPELVYSPGVDLRGPVRSAEVEDEQATRKRNCKYIEQAIEQIDERMRHGYGSVEGEQLRDHRRRLSNELDDCKLH